MHRPARNHYSPREPLRWELWFHFCLQKQLSSQTPFRNGSPAPSPPPMSSVSLSRHGVHHQARPSSHSIACKAIIYRHLVFCLTSVWCWSSSLCLKEALVREGCGSLMSVNWYLDSIVLITSEVEDCFILMCCSICFKSRSTCSYLLFFPHWTVSFIYPG